MLFRHFSPRTLKKMTSSAEFSARRMIAAYSKGWTQDDNLEDYINAIKKLNRLQSNSATIKESLVSGTVGQNLKYKDTITYLERSGILLEDLDKLSVIHVSGTKGKVNIICIHFNKENQVITKFLRERPVRLQRLSLGLME